MSGINFTAHTYIYICMTFKITKLKSLGGRGASHQHVPPPSATALLHDAAMYSSLARFTFHILIYFSSSRRMKIIFPLIQFFQKNIYNIMDMKVGKFFEKSGTMFYKTYLIVINQSSCIELVINCQCIVSLTFTQKLLQLSSI